MSSSSAAFKIFLEQKQQSGNDKFDWTKRKNQWISSIEDLYKLVTTWLEPFKRDKLLSMKITMIDLTEDYLGNYKVPLVVLTFAGQFVWLHTSEYHKRLPLPDWIPRSFVN